MPSIWPRPLGARHAEPFASIVSGIPLLNFPVPHRQAYVQTLTERLAPGAALIQFSYGMPAAGGAAARSFSVDRAALVWANLPPARVWVYRKI